MKKDDFIPHARYTVAMRTDDGKIHPANFYVFRLYDDFMIARMTDNGGLLYKVKYDSVEKIVRYKEVPPEDRFYIPEAVLKENVWRDRVKMERYSTSPHMGK